MSRAGKESRFKKEVKSRLESDSGQKQEGEQTRSSMSNKKPVKLLRQKKLIKKYSFSFI